MTRFKLKIVLVGSLDKASRGRGYIGCFKSLGCGSLFLSDEGNYPAGMIADDNLVTYSTSNSAVDLLRQLLNDDDQRSGIAVAGHAMIAEEYSKARQREPFFSLTH